MVLFIYVARPPRYPHVMWVYGSTYYTDNVPRANGFLEGFHSVINQVLDARHKTLYYVMLHLKKIQLLTIARLGANSVGKCRGFTRSRKWQRLRERTKKIICADDGDSIETLRALANASAVAVSDVTQREEESAE